MDTLLYIVIGLGLIAIWQVVRVYELSEELKGSEREVVTDGENRFNSIMILLAMIGFMVTCVYEFMEYGKYLLPEASSEHGPACLRSVAVATRCPLLRVLCEGSKGPSRSSIHPNIPSRNTTTRMPGSEARR